MLGSPRNEKVKMMQPVISFIMPVFDVELYLAKAIKSVLLQTYPNWELVIVNDGSHDNSLKICEEFAEVDSRIKVHSQVNQGQGVARNVGLDFSRGRYICFVDPDDWVEKDLVECLVPLMDDQQHVDFACFGIDFVDERGNIAKSISQFDYHELNGDLIFQDAMLDRNIFSSPCNKVYRASFLRDYKIYFPSTRAYEDIYYSRLASLFAKKCLFIDKVFYHALMRAGSTTRKMGFEKIYEALKIVQIGKEMFLDGRQSELNRALYKAHVAKFISYLIFQAAYRMPSRTEFNKFCSLARHSKYIEFAADSTTFVHLKLKNKLIIKAATYPSLTWFAMKLLGLLGFRLY